MRRQHALGPKAVERSSSVGKGGRGVSGHGAMFMRLRVCEGRANGTVIQQSCVPRERLPVAPPFVEPPATEAAAGSGTSAPRSADEAAANTSTPAVLLTYATRGYVHWASHLHRNLLQLGVRPTHPLHVCVPDEDFCSRQQHDDIALLEPAKMGAKEAFPSAKRRCASKEFGTQAPLSTW